jgi:hypothetical protein
MPPENEGRPPGRPALPHTHRKYRARAAERQARATGGLLVRVATILELDPLVCQVRRLRSDVPDNIVVRRAPVEGPRAAAGGAR